MDSFMSLAKQGLKAYESSQTNVNETGQDEQSNEGQQRPHGSNNEQEGGQQGGGYQGYNNPSGGGGYQGYNNPEGGYNQTGGAQYNRPAGQNHQQSYGNADGPDLDEDTVVNHASKHSGESGDSSLFSSAMGFIKGNKSQQHEDVDEDGVQDAHNKAYNQGNAGGLDAGGMGAAAAMQAMKMFTGGGSSGGSGGGDMQSKLIGMAMSEAAKLFDQSGGASGGNKQDAVNSAGMTVMKLLVKSKMSGMTGGSDSGGLGQLMGLASKFM